MPEGKNVYILGAGASKCMGLPLQDDFMQIAREIYSTNNKRYDYFSEVFEYQNSKCIQLQFLNYPIRNLESLFNIVEMDLFYSKSSKAGRVKKIFKQMICDVLEKKTPLPFYYDGPDMVPLHAYEPHVRLLKIVNHRDENGKRTNKDSIITLNYDLALEYAACVNNFRIMEYYRRRGGVEGSNGGIIFFDHIFDKSKIDIETISNNNYKKYYPARTTSYIPLYENNYDSEIKYIKLHGSVNWKIEKNKEPFIIPPSWNKSDPRIRELWEAAYNELMQAKRIIFFGYSFPATDIYVKSLLALALNRNPVLSKIILINPDEKLNKKAFDDLVSVNFKKDCKTSQLRFEQVFGAAGQEYLNDVLVRPYSGVYDQW